MKYQIFRIILTVGWALSLITPAVASVQYSPAQCDQIARAIVRGQRPPLTNQELTNLDAPTVDQLTRSLAKAYAELPGVQPEPQQNPAQVPATDQQPTNPNSQPDQQVTTDDQSGAPQADDSALAARVPLSKNQQEFINLISADAQQIAQDHDLYASVLIAQAVLESDWGRSDLAQQHYNLFGIKGSYQGMSAEMPTTEHIGGQDVQVQAAFRKYPSLKTSLQDYAKVLGQSMYAGVHKRTAANYREATRNLNQVYATDPHYHQKLNRVIEMYDLTKYDGTTTAKPLGKSFDRSAPIANQSIPQTKSVHDPKKKKSNIVIPLVGGISSMSIVEVMKRLLKK
ncbi:glycoside hydrolase family 73 protein [Limosilactobacillus caecicola]|uniref:glycoside hydrolase family 73 protein n=1 Tax=Limosilactobacillus caecicola TaxID=2941332 RepID=UPI00203CE7C3|nr:glucosaminidase domain-containing protein [Limosilactobacillus caecicola]